MNPNDTQILKVTNIADIEFTPDMGAQYGGVQYPLRAGGSLLAPYSVAHHLAKHLARQIILKGAPIRDEKETDGKGNDRPLITDEKVEALKVKILTDAYVEEKEPELTQDQITANKIKELNENSAPETPAPTEGYQDKAEVIAELDKRGIKYDARKSKANLETLLG